MTSRPFPINKIVYFVEAYFNARDYIRFGIQTFIDNGFEVEVWDFTPFMAPDEYIKGNAPPQFDCQNWFLFHNKKDALSAISQLTPSIFVISMMHYNQKSISIHRMLLKKGIKYCADTMALPTVDRSQVEIPKRVSRKLKQVKWEVILNKILYSLPYGLLGVKPADLVLARGEKYGTSGLAVTEKSEVVWAHSYDYDIYLREREVSGEVDKSKGVFIDEYIPFHPDFAYSGVQVPVTPDEYYPKLCGFFDFLERNFGYKIVIAAHPRSCYEAHHDFFNGRPVIRGRTLELVKSAGFIIMHTSTAINFAVLYKKPVIIVTTDKYNAGWNEDPTPDWLAAFFGKKAHNLDYPVEFDHNKEFHVDEKTYSTYRNAYIKKDGTADLPSWQILANRIKDIK